MISYTQGNLLEARVDALVNTVNTVGVMGAGIALMFKERFGRNFDLYAAACKAQQVKVGEMFLTETGELDGPRWIINFPTKEHWKGRSRLEWVESGLEDLKRVLRERKIRSVAIPPLGAGNGGLDWPTVRARIHDALVNLEDLDVIVYEPTHQYQNVTKRAGVQKLTPARALVAEAVRRYWVLGMVDWLLSREGVEPTVPAVLAGLAHWPADDASGAGQRKRKIFDERSVRIALTRLLESPLSSISSSTAM